MASSKYIDIPSIVQVIGCVFKSPQLLDYTDKYVIVEDDSPKRDDEYMQLFSKEFIKIWSKNISFMCFQSIDNQYDYILYENASKMQALKLDRVGW